MKVFVSLFALFVIALARPDDKYTDRYDNIDLDNIIHNRRLLVPYIKCVLEQGKCSPEGKELKSHMKEALENDCAKCTDTQRKGTRTVISHLINHEAAFWDELTAKFDPDNKLRVKYEKDLKTIA